MRWRWILAVFFGLIAGQAFSETVYRHSLPSIPLTLDPIAYSDGYANKIAGVIYDTLYQYKYLRTPLELKPMIAETMPLFSADGLTLTIPIKKKVFFADDPAFPNGKGRELLAEDFVYSLKRHFDPKNVSSNRWIWADKIVGLDEWGANGADYTKTIEGLRALNRYTLQIKLKKASPQILYTLAMGNSAIVPKEAVAYYGKELAIHPVGSGPFKLISFDNSKAVLTKNTNFRKEAFDPVLEGYDEALHGFTGIAKLKGKFPPFVDKLEVYFMERESALWNSFTKGNEIQFGSVPILQFKNIVKSTEPLVLHEKFAEKYKTTKELESTYTYFGFNMEHPEIGVSEDPVRNQRNKALRCAIRKAHNWRQLIDRHFYGIGEAFPGIIPPHILGHDPDLSRDSVTLDVEGAKKLLSENGWNAETLPVLRYSGEGTLRNKQKYEMFKDWMVKIGYPPHKIAFDMSSHFGDYTKAVREKKLMTLPLSWCFDFPDAQNSYQLYYGPHSSPGSNFSNYRNAEYDELFEKADLMMPGPERAQIYKRLNQILTDDCVVISGYTRTRIHLWHKNVILFPTEFANGEFLRYVAVE